MVGIYSSYVNLFLLIILPDGLIEWLYDALETDWRFDLGLILLLLIIIFFVGSRWHHDKDCRIHRILIGCASLELLWLNPYQWAKLMGLCDVRFLFAISLVIGLSIEVKKYSRKQKTNRAKDNAKGFPVDVVHPIANKNYVRTVVESLLNTDLSQKAFSVGIAGEWGSGKTTFLETIKEALKEKCYIVDFNPWIYTDSSQVLTDFFRSVQKVVGKDHSQLSRPISHYVYSLTKEMPIGVIKWLGAVYQSLNSDSIGDRKRKLSESLSKLEKPIVVFIDDVDRLESKEIFEVLRLIRNTGDLTNVIYISAYDKDYVVNLLKDTGVKSAETYLEKIFDIEIQLPKAENYQLEEVLMSGLNSLGLPESFSNNVKRTLTYDNVQMALMILGSYRQVKRFTRTFCLNMQYMGVNFSKEFRGRDLFWLILLQMYDRCFYENLYQHPMRFLYTDSGSYILRFGISNEDTKGIQKEHIYEGERIWKTHTPYLLEQMFKRGEDDMFGIKYLDCFDRYFSLAFNPHRIREIEFGVIYKKDASIQTIVDEWVERRIYPSCLWRRFKRGSKETKSLEEQKLFIESYSRILVQYLCLSSLKDSDLKKIYQRSYYGTNGSEALVHFVEIFNDMIDSGRYSYAVMEALRKLWITKIYNQGFHVNNNESSLYLYSNEDVSRLMARNMNRYLDKHPDVSILDIFDPRSCLGRLVKSSTVQLCSETTYADGDEFENQVKDVLINHFSKVEKSYESSELDHNYKAMFPIKEPEGEYMDTDDYYNKEIEEREYNYIVYFGNDSKWVDELIFKCSKCDKKKNE
jgi:hypothetical protein